MALALDGSGSASNGSASSINVSITTANANDIIILAAEANGGPITGVSGGGLTWVFKGRDTNGPSSPMDLWYAVAAGTLSAASITVTQTSAAFISVGILGISGADTSTIFDGAIVTGHPDPISISTSNANTFIVGAFREGLDASPTAGSGWTQVVGSNFLLLEYQIVSSTQTNLSVSQTTGAGNSNGGVAIAVLAAAGGGGGRTAIVVPGAHGPMVI